MLGMLRLAKDQKAAQAIMSGAFGNFITRFCRGDDAI